MVYGKTAHVRLRGAVGTTCRPAIGGMPARRLPPHSASLPTHCLGQLVPPSPARGTPPEYSPTSGCGPTKAVACQVHERVMPPRGFMPGADSFRGGKSGPERADHGMNDGVIERATVHAQSFEEGEAVQGCKQS
jgi:hypothetical protein